MSLLTAWWADVRRVDPDPEALRGALRVATAVTAPLVALVAVGHVDWAPYGVFGSLSAVYGKRFGYADRLHAGLGMTIVLTCAIALGVLAGCVGSLGGGAGPALSDRLAGSVAVVAMALLSLIGALVSAWRGWLPVPSLFLVFACGTVAAARHHVADLPVAVAVSLAAGLFGVALGQVGRILRHSPWRRRSSAPPRVVPMRDVVRATGARQRLLVHFAAPLAAGLLAVALGIDHPAWAAVSATVPLVGASTASMLARASHRAAGTAAGVLLAVAFLAAAPPMWLLLAAVAVFQLLTELLVARNYGLAVIAITPLALIMTRLAAPSPPLELGAARLVETGLGLGVSVLLALIAARRPGRHRGGTPALRLPAPGDRR